MTKSDFVFRYFLNYCVMCDAVAVEASPLIIIIIIIITTPMMCVVHHHTVRCLKRATEACYFLALALAEITLCTRTRTTNVAMPCCYRVVVVVVGYDPSVGERPLSSGWDCGQHYCDLKCFVVVVVLRGTDTRNEKQEITML
jgi:hypothetical protein